MAYVTLDANNNVTGVFTMPQPHLTGYAVIDDADPRIATFQAAQTAAMQAVQPTLAQLQAQITTIAAQITALQNAGT